MADLHSVKISIVDPRRAREPRGLSSWQAHRAQDLILAHLDEGISVCRLAQACALSRSDFSRKFKTSFGLSPHDWLRHQRIEKAKRLLREPGRRLVEIGVECGFFDQAHFCRVFARVVGLTPRNWRACQAETPGCPCQRMRAGERHLMREAVAEK